MRYSGIILLLMIVLGSSISCKMARDLKRGIVEDEKPVSIHTWIVTAGEERYTLTYKQIGEYIRGKIVAFNDINNENEISGKIEDRKINFQIYIMGRLTQEYDGILSKDGFKIKGTRTVDGRKGLDWSAENVDEKN